MTISAREVGPTRGNSLRLSAVWSFRLARQKASRGGQAAPVWTPTAPLTPYAGSIEAAREMLHNRARLRPGPLVGGLTDRGALPTVSACEDTSTMKALHRYLGAAGSVGKVATVIGPCVAQHCLNMIIAHRSSVRDTHRVFRCSMSASHGGVSAEENHCWAVSLTGLVSQAVNSLMPQSDECRPLAA
jgi:hypothetical protein